MEKFYLYDNESTDDTTELLAPYIKSGIVEYTYFPGLKRQLPAYGDCLEKRKVESKWIAFIDLDEFLFPVQDDNITDWLKTIPDGTSQILVHWHMFGSSGHEKRPDGPVLENYKFRGHNIYSKGHQKSILNPRMVLEPGVHYFRTVQNTVDESGRTIRRKGYELPSNRIRINHYHCKSWEDYQARNARGCVFFGVPNYSLEGFKKHDHNDIYDYSAERFVKKLKK